MATKPARIPIYLAPLEGEPIDSWLDAYASRLGVTVGELWLHLFPALPPPREISALYLRLDEPALAHLAAVSGVAAGHLAGAVPRYLKLLPRRGLGVSEIQPLARSRWCPQCLAERGGRWRSVWRHPLSFGCVDHGCVLLDLCPRCKKGPRRTIGMGSVPLLGHCSGPSLTQSRSSGSKSEICGMDLRSADADQMGPEAVDHQRVILKLIHEAEAGSDTATTRLRDVFIVARAGSHAYGHTPDAGRLASAIPEAIPYAYPESGAARIREQALRDLGRRSWAFTTVTVGLSPAPKRIILAARDQHLAPILRLRHATVSVQPFADLDCDAESTRRRAARIPDLLWRGLALSLQSQPHPSIAALRNLGPLALLIPGSGRPIGALSTDAGGRFRARGLDYALRQWSDSRHGTEVLRVLAEAACLVDEGPTVIDYQRRQAMIADRPMIDSPTWIRFCRVNNIEPGLDRRLLLVNAYLFELTTGGDPSKWSHCRILRDAPMWAQYREFCVRLDVSSVQMLRAHATEWLHHSGIDEPLEWAPSWSDNGRGAQLGQVQDEFPASIVHGLLDQGEQLGQIASSLGVGLEHLRLAMLDHPRPDPTAASPAKRTARRKPRVAELGCEYLARELAAGVSLTELATRTGYSRTLIGEVLREHHLPAPGVGPKETSIDTRWFEREYWDKRRTLPDIADELGMSAGNLSRRAKEAGIPVRARGGGSHEFTFEEADLAKIPRPLRDALRGRAVLGRLERFLTLSQSDSIGKAARSTGSHMSVFSIQLARLEADTGLELLRRHPGGLGHQELTPAGQLLVKQYKAWLRQRPLPPTRSLV